jgi:hypothetical protein
MRLKQVVRGLAAGAAGTAAMTGHQEIRDRLARGDAEPGSAEDANGDGGEREDPWESAPAPAQVGKRLIEAVLGWRVPPEAIPLLTKVMHWSYGTLWGGVYAVGRESSRTQTRLAGPVFGLGVWATSYAQLVPLGIYEPPWRYPWQTLADEIGYHLTYGITVALTYALVDGGTV